MNSSHPSHWLNILNDKEQQVRRAPTQEAIQEITRLGEEARSNIIAAHHAHQDLALLYLKIIELLTSSPTEHSADAVEYAVDLIDWMKAKKIAVKCADFYLLRAHIKYKYKNNIDGALRILHKGITQNAVPIEKLHDKVEQYTINKPALYSIDATQNNLSTQCSNLSGAVGDSTIEGKEQDSIRLAKITNITPRPNTSSTQRKGFRPLLSKRFGPPRRVHINEDVVFHDVEAPSPGGTPVRQAESIDYNMSDADVSLSHTDPQLSKASRTNDEISLDLQTARTDSYIPSTPLRAMGSKSYALTVPTPSSTNNHSDISSENHRTHPLSMPLPNAMNTPVRTNSYLPNDPPYVASQILPSTPYSTNIQHPTNTNVQRPSPAPTQVSQQPFTSRELAPGASHHPTGKSQLQNAKLLVERERIVHNIELARQWCGTPFWVNGRPYLQLEMIGRGGSSQVFKVLGPDLKLYALKKVSYGSLDSDAIESYKNEIELLTKLQGSKTIIELRDAEINENYAEVLIVLELGELDLMQLIKENSQNGVLQENYLRVYWQQMLEAVHTIHEARIVHTDLKPANFVYTRGTLKLIDFGIAKAIANDTTNIVRENQVGTLNYISPEALTGISTEGDHQITKLGRASDIWSLGCILYQMVYGNPPFQPIKNMVQKMRCITDPTYKIPYPPHNNEVLVDVIKKCLQHTPAHRATIPQLLNHPFLSPNNIPRS